MRSEIAPAHVLLHIVGQRVRLLGLEKSKPGVEPMRTVVDVEAYLERLRNQKRNGGA